MPDPRHSPNAARARPRAVLLLLGAGLALSCHLDELLRAPQPAEGGQQQAPPPGATAVRLAFTVQPATSRREAPITPAVEVTAVDQAGGTVATFTGEVDVDLTDGPEDADLSGTTSRRAVAGRAVFDDLKLDETGLGYRLVARANGLESATSAPFDITRRDPSVLLPVSGDGQIDTVGAALAPYVVRVTDDAGAPVGGVEIFWVAEGPGGAVSPTATLTDAAGEARTIHTLGTVTGEYGAIAWTPELPDRAVTFAATARAGTATQLVFTQQPTTTERRQRISPPVRVTARDRHGNTVTGYSTTVQVDIAAGTGAPGAHLEGDRSRPPADGTATFNDLKIDDVGFGYRLLATSGQLSVISDPFHILLLAVDDGVVVGAPLADALEFRR